MRKLSTSILHAYLFFLLLSFVSSPITWSQDKSADAVKDAAKIRAVLDEYLAKGNLGELDKFIDQEQFLDIVFKGLPENKEFRKGFVKGVAQSGGLRKLITNVSDAKKNGGDYRWVRDIQDGDEVRPLYRLYLPDVGINYHEWKIAKGEKGPCIVDVYIHLSGEYFSDTIRRLILPGINAAEPNLLSKFLGGKSQVLKGYEDLQKANQLKQAGDFKGALAILDKLPKELQADKAVNLVKLVVAQKIDEKTNERVITEIAKKFPNDPSMRLCMLDYLAMTGKSEELLELVNQLYDQLQDPFLQSLKIDALLNLGRTKEAEKSIELAINKLPDMIDLYWSRLGIVLASEQHEKTAKYLSEIQSKFNIDFKSLSTLPEYAKFTASPEGKAWMAVQERQSK